MYIQIIVNLQLQRCLRPPAKMFVCRDSVQPEGLQIQIPTYRVVGTTGIRTGSIYPSVYLPVLKSIYTMLYECDENPEAYDVPRIGDMVSSNLSDGANPLQPETPDPRTS